MNLKDATRNQHFVPQVEQRLNAINPSAREENQRVYAFNLVDRENYELKIISDNGTKISNSLSLNDLFSFDILKEHDDRYNFEKLFHKYELNIKKNTQSLLEKLATTGADIKSEVLDIFTSKFLNFVRNPYSIKKILNTFPSLTNVHPTNPVHYKNFERVLKGRKPQQKHLCEKLGISEREYTDWLSIIFLLLTPLDKDNSNFLEQVIKGLYESPESFIMVLIYTYDEKTCLLSDRGYSIPLPEQDHMAFDFNLCSNAFIRYAFSNIDALAPPEAPRELVEVFKSRPKTIDVHSFVNDLSALEQYNKHVVYQCFETVFNSSTECYGL
jgi:hypothetical protein